MFKRLSGRNSYEASFKGALTRLTRKSYRNFHFKTIRNGIVSGFSGSILENIVGGLYDGIKEWYNEIKFPTQN